MKAIKSVDVKSFVLYGAIVAAFWTLVIGIYYWILGWIFGATFLVDRREPRQLDRIYPGRLWKSFFTRSHCSCWRCVSGLGDRTGL